MNVQEAVKQTLAIYKDEDEYQSIDNAMDYLLQIMKVDDEARIKKAVYDATHPTKDFIADPYMSGYCTGWNNALDCMAKAGDKSIAGKLYEVARSMKKA